MLRHVSRSAATPLLVVVLGLCLAAALAWLGTGGDDQPPPTTSNGPLAAAETATDGSVRGADAGPWLDDREQLDDPDEDDLARREVEDIPEATATEGLMVTVVDEADRPVAGAALHYTDYRSAEQWRRDHDVSRRVDLASLAVDCGRRLTTGADGTVTLPPGELRGPLFAASTTDGRFGALNATRSRRNTREFTVRVAPDETLVVQVVDPDGKPLAGREVSVLQTDGERRRRELWEADSDAAGRVVVPHFQLQRRDRDDDDRADRFVALLDIADNVPAATEFTGRPAPAEPVVVQAPWTTALTLRVVDADGQPLRAPFWIGVDPAEPQATAVPVPDSERDVWGRKDAGEQVAQFDAVGRGVLLRARLRSRDNRDLGWTSEPFQTAWQPGSALEHDIPIPDWLTVLSGTATLETTGQPAAGARISWQLSAADNPIETWRNELFEDGGFELMLAPKNNAERAPFGLDAQLRDDGVGMLGTRCAPPRLTPGQRIELGELRLGPLPMIAAGLCVDDRGQPVREVGIRIEERRGDDRWRGDRLLRTDSGRDGRFELQGNLEPGVPLRLTADRRGYAQTIVQISPGATDLRLVLPRMGALAARFAVPPSVRGRTLSVVLRPRDGGDAVRRNIDRRGGNAAFRIDELQPGSYDAAVELRGFSAPLAAVAGVLVRPGETSRDQRLDGLDLGASAFPYTVRVIADNGLAAEDMGGVVLAQRADPATGKPSWTAFPLNNGEARFHLPDPQTLLTVIGTGRRPQQVPAATGETNVYVPNLHPAELELPGVRELVGERRVRVSMVYRGDTGLPTSLRSIDQNRGRDRSLQRAELGKSGGAWLPDQGNFVRVPLALDGEYDVVLRVYPENGRGGPRSQNVARLPIDLDGAVPSRHRVDVDPQQIRELMGPPPD